MMMVRGLLYKAIECVAMRVNEWGRLSSERDDFSSRGNADDDGKKLVYIFHKNSHSLFHFFFIPSSSSILQLQG